MRTEIVVIGAGVIGAAIALALARAGRRVLLIDRAGPAAGSSGACDGYLSVSTKVPGITMDLAAASLDLYPAFVERLGAADVDFCRSGGLMLLESAADEAAMARHLAALHGNGVEARLLNGHAARALEPALGPIVRGAVQCPGEFTVNPYQLNLATVAAAGAAGAETLFGAEVIGFDRAGAAVDAVLVGLPDGAVRRLAVEQVVLAAGARAAALGDLLGLALPVIPRRGELVLTERGRPLAQRFLVSASYLLAKIDPEEAQRSPDPLRRIGHGFTLEPLSTGQMLIGSTRVFAGFDRRASEAGSAAILRQAVLRVPALAERRVLRVFAGLRPFVPDRRPLLGRSRLIPNVIVATGHEGDGITQTPITAAIVNALVHGKAPPFDITALDPDRFVGKAGSGIGGP